MLQTGCEFAQKSMHMLRIHLTFLLYSVINHLTNRENHFFLQQGCNVCEFSFVNL